MKIDDPMRRTRMTRSLGARVATGARWLLVFAFVGAACSRGDAPPAFSHPTEPAGDGIGGTSGLGGTGGMGATGGIGGAAGGVP
jgi:hypothetical protein